MRRGRSWTALLCLALTVPALSACGGGDDDGGNASASAREEGASPAGRRAATREREDRAEAAEQGSLAPSAEVGGVGSVRQALPRFFSPQSPWNVEVSTLAAAPDSDRLLSLARLRTGVIESDQGIRQQPRLVPDGVFVNTSRWTTPIVTGEGGQPTRVFCRQARCGTDATDLRTLTIPAQANPDPRYDGWFTVIDRARNVAWDFWRARRQQDGSISFQFVRKWELDGPGYLAPSLVSARGSGLPLFAGVITADELERGQIQHALAISVPGPASSFYVQPASSTDGNGSPQSLPEGARIRLRAAYTLRTRQRGRKRRVAEAIVVALQRYGAIVVDRAAVPTLYAQKDVSVRFLDGFELGDIHLTDFEVLPLGRRYRYPALATSRQVGTGATGATGPTAPGPASTTTGAVGPTAP